MIYFLYIHKEKKKYVVTILNNQLTEDSARLGKYTVYMRTKKIEFIRYRRKKLISTIFRQSALTDQSSLRFHYRQAPSYYAKCQEDAKTIPQGLSFL